jgi:hypothetical protein
MPENHDLEYEVGSYPDEFSEERARAFEDWLQECQSNRIKFDPSYLDHLRSHNGGVPKKCYFKTAKGTKHVVVRFLSFLPDESTSPFAQYGVEGTWGLIEDRLGKYLIPFAELFAGDMLCFDFKNGSPPSVVVWFHERSREKKPYAEFVAADFNSFLPLLAEKS